MARPIDLDEYSTVSERIHSFYARHPAGSIRTELVVLKDDLVVFQARVYRDAHDPHPATGWAYERHGAATTDPARLIENCETAAVGRALANRGLTRGRRPSREEMAKVERMRQAVPRRRATPRGARAAAAPDPPVRAVPAPARIRALLPRLTLSRSKRERIEARLEAGASARELDDLEAYLMALLARQ